MPDQYSIGRPPLANDSARLAEIARLDRLVAATNALDDTFRPGERPPQGGAPGPGLVHSKQRERETRGDLEIPTDSQLPRARRCRYRTLTAARLVNESVRRGGFRGRFLFLTLTYRYTGDWRPDHIRDFHRRARVWFRRLGLDYRYIWTGELQKRGAMHYHVIVWVPRHVMLPKPDKRGWWPHGMSNVQVARNPVGYIAKYASKGVGVVCDAEGREIRVPRGARLCGSGGLDAPGRMEYRFWCAPRWARAAASPDGAIVDLRRCRGGFVERGTGAFFESPWEFVAYDLTRRVLVFRLKEALHDQKQVP